MGNKTASYRNRAIVICLAVYVAALGIAVGAGYLLRSNNPVLIAAVADVAATVAVFVFSVIFNNSSIYDPYWSLAPLPVALYWMFVLPSPAPVLIRHISVMVLLSVWAVRLTYNCFRRWKDLSHEDWRYVEIRRKTGRLYWPASFFGIHLFPTIIVFAGCLSLYVALSTGIRQFNLLDIAAIFVTGMAIIIEAKADWDLKNFLATRKSVDENISNGLWAYSRHPNYFGEVLFWWGLYLFALAANPGFWWVIIGPVCITGLFVFISVPMMDRHILSRRQSYADSMEKVSAFIPWFPRNKAGI